ncbi:hypothetical protein [Antrihabitans spumae]|uniref:WXG100 family type VII secretion target n=1 Tax=Antrihabitans spumae TaxID=3373370 RepID=A0ABW7KMA7_9NOCA
MAMDIAAVRGVVEAMTRSADAVAHASSGIGSCSFGSGATGRNYGPEGAALFAGYERLQRAIDGWSVAIAAAARGVEETVDSYESMDSSTSTELGGLHP